MHPVTALPDDMHWALIGAKNEGEGKGEKDKLTAKLQRRDVLVDCSISDSALSRAVQQRAEWRRKAGFLACDSQERRIRRCKRTGEGFPRSEDSGPAVPRVELSMSRTERFRRKEETSLALAESRGREIKQEVNERKEWKVSWGREKQRGSKRRMGKQCAK